MIRAYRGATPQIAASAYIDETALVIGNVTIGERASVWPQASVRGDVNTISIGDETNIQDNVTLHCDEGLYPLKIGNRVTVGHHAMVHGCTVEDECLIGIGAIILNGAVVGRGSVIAAAALVPEGTIIPPNSMAMGVPAKVRRTITPEETQRFRLNTQHYVELAEIYRGEQSK